MQVLPSAVENGTPGDTVGVNAMKKETLATCHSSSLITSPKIGTNTHTRVQTTGGPPLAWNGLVRPASETEHRVPGGVYVSIGYDEVIFLHFIAPLVALVLAFRPSSSTPGHCPYYARVDTGDTGTAAWIPDGCGLVRCACDGVEVLSSLRPILGRVCQDASQDFCSLLIIVPKGRYPVGYFSNSLFRDHCTLLQKNRGVEKGLVRDHSRR